MPEALRHKSKLPLNDMLLLSRFPSPTQLHHHVITMDPPSFPLHEAAREGKST